MPQTGSTTSTEASGEAVVGVLIGISAEPASLPARRLRYLAYWLGLASNFVLQLFEQK